MMSRANIDRPILHIVATNVTVRVSAEHRRTVGQVDTGIASRRRVQNPGTS
jgi:hypothetical protein